MRKTMVALGVLSLLAVFVIGGLSIPVADEIGIVDYTDKHAVELSGEISYMVVDAETKNVNFEGIEPNLVTTAGRNLLKEVFGTGAVTEAVNKFALGNGTAPAAGSTTLDDEITDCGLARATATTYVDNGDGDWTWSETFTSTCDGVAINTTALFNATSAGTMYAGDTFASTITMDSSDTLQLNWTCTGTPA